MFHSIIHLNNFPMFFLSYASWPSKIISFLLADQRLVLFPPFIHLPTSAQLPDICEVSIWPPINRLVTNSFSFQLFTVISAQRKFNTCISLSKSCEFVLLLSPDRQTFALATQYVYLWFTCHEAFIVLAWIEFKLNLGPTGTHQIARNRIKIGKLYRTTTNLAFSSGHKCQDYIGLDEFISKFCIICFGQFGRQRKQIEHLLIGII